MIEMCWNAYNTMRKTLFCDVNHETRSSLNALRMMLVIVNSYRKLTLP